MESDEVFESQARDLKTAGQPPYTPARLDAQNTISAIDVQEAMRELENENLMIEDPIEYENQQIDYVRGSLGGLDGAGTGQRDEHFG